MFGPPGLPREIVLKLQREISAVLRDPQNARQIAADGGQAVGNSPEEFGAFFKGDIDKWARVARNIHIEKE